MNRLFFLLLSLLIQVSLFAQVNTDSLHQIWLDESNNDSTRMLAYANYVYYEYMLKQPDSAEFYVAKAFGYAQEMQLENFMVSVKRMAGQHYFETGAYRKAIATYDEALALAEEFRDTLGSAMIILRKGWLFHDNGLATQATKMYEEALRIFIQYDSQWGIAAVYNELGSLYLEDGHHEKSLEYYLRALEVDSTIQPTLDANMASVYLAMDSLEKAYALSQQVLDEYLKTKDQKNIAMQLGNLGGIYAQMNQVAQARSSYTKALTLARKISFVQTVNAALMGLADLDLDEGHLQAAATRCQEALNLSQEIGDLNDERAACECLYEVNKKQGRNNRALTYYESMVRLNDSLQLRERTSQLQRFEFEAQLREDSLLQIEKDLQVEMAFQSEIRKKEKNRNVAFGAGGFFLLLALGFFIRSRLINKSRKIIQKEKDRSENLLLNILPAEIAEELKATGQAKARHFQDVSILFTDFKNFTQYSEKVSAEVLVEEINDCFKEFDRIVEKYGVEKIKTIGDAYMAAGGLPVPLPESVENTVQAALEMQDFIARRLAAGKSKIPFEMRVGIHTGSIVAGIVGIKKFQYDVWGDTVNTASRMESSGETGKVNISDTTYMHLRENPRFRFQPRPEIEVKGKGMMTMYFVEQTD